MTLSLANPEIAALEELALRKDLSKAAVLRQALRLYQLIETRRELGEKLVFEDSLGEKKSELMLL
jgi:hypothetical protein